MNKLFLLGIFIAVVSNTSFAENEFKWKSPVGPGGDYVKRKNSDGTGAGRRGNIYEDRKEQEYRNSDPNLNGQVERKRQYEYQGSPGYGGGTKVVK